jgi:hypothetical protein
MQRIRSFVGSAFRSRRAVPSGAARNAPALPGLSEGFHTHVPRETRRFKAWKLCAASVDYSNRRRGDRTRSLMPQRAARGAGSRGSLRLDPPLRRPLTRRRAVNRLLHYAFTQEAWPPRALNSVRDPISRARTAQLPKSSDHAHDGRLDSVGFRRPRGSESG